MNAIPRLRDYRGPAIFSYGFRPFFFLGACYAALGIAVWLPFFVGEISLPTLLSPRDWHVHEMLYGYVSAVLTGFLLTAIPNWTGRLPLQGSPLVVLVAVWLAGRIAVSMSAHLGWVAASIIDCAFLFLVLAATAREIIAGQNWANLKVMVPVGVLAIGNVGFHVEAQLRGVAALSTRIGVAAIVVLLMIVAGRIIPSFTRNWLNRANPGRMPIPFSRFDIAVIVFSVGALAIWAIFPETKVTGILLILAALLQLVRLGRWAGDRALREPLVVILHVGYAFVPLGFFLMALGAFQLVLQTAGFHAWMVGAVGVLTIAVMTRASLGHTGRQLTADRVTQLIYLMVIVAGCVRIAAALFPAWSIPLLYVAGIAWTLAFAGFVVAYARVLFRPRLIS
jgi:uncharacterized protein involved in response to NO